MRYFDVDDQPTTHIDGGHGWDSEYDSRGNRISERYVGVDGKPATTNSGFSIARMDYDHLGRKTSELYMDEFGEPSTHSDGNHGWHAEYDVRGNQRQKTRIDVDGNPTLNKYGYAITRKTFNESGRQTSLSYFDADGRPTTNTDGIHGWNAQHNEAGYEVERSFFDIRGEVAYVDDGFAVQNSVYDVKGLLVERRFFDRSMNPVSNGTEGYHGRTMQYDDKGREVVRSFIGVDGKPVQIKLGYASRRMEYDRLGNLVSQLHFDVNGEPTIRSGGYHGWTSSFDVHNRETGRKYVGPDGKTVASNDGHSQLLKGYDVRGNQITQRYFGADGEPTVHANGHHGWNAIFDAHGNQLKKVFVSAMNEPCTVANGYAVVQSTYDHLGHRTSTRYYDTKEKPATHRDGYHGWDAAYDPRGNRTEERYVDIEQQPAVIGQGYASLQMTYDIYGNELSRHYFGIGGKPAARSDGVHGWSAIVDRHGHQRRVDYVDIDGEPIQGGGQFATKQIDRDARGRVTRVRYLDVDGNLTTDSDGSFGFVAEYDVAGSRQWEGSLNSKGWVSSWKRFERDRFGAVVKESTYDSAKAAKLTSGQYHSVKYTRDAFGRKIETTFQNLDGTPVSLNNAIATIRDEYDRLGHNVRTSYWDASGNATSHALDGNHALSREFNSHGRILTLVYTDTDDNPVLMDAGYAALRNSYDQNGRLLSVHYLDRKLNPTIPHGLGYAGLSHKYDEAGNRILTSYVDADESPVAPPSFGFASIRMKYDQRRRQTLFEYFDANGQLTQEAAGFSRMEVQHNDDENEKVVTMTGFGDDARFSTCIEKHDLQLGRARVQYFSKDGDVVRGLHGESFEERLFADDLKTVIRSEFVEPLLYPGVSKLISIPHTDSRSVELSFVDGSNAPIDGGPYQARRIISRRNAAGLYVKHEHLDCKLQGGIVRVEVAVDPSTGTTTTVFFDAQQQRTRHPAHGALAIRSSLAGQIAVSEHLDCDGRSGAYKVISKTDNKRGTHTEEYFRKDGRRAEMDNGPQLSGFTAIDTRAFLSDGNSIEIVYRGFVGRPYAIAQADRDLNSNSQVITFRDAEGSLVNDENGIGKFVQQLDKKHSIVECRYFGIDGEPVSHPDGEHGWNAEYDQLGNQTFKQYIGIDGKPMKIRQGYSASRMAYDDRGYKSSQSYFDLNGQPVLTDEGLHRWTAAIEWFRAKSNGSCIWD